MTVRPESDLIGVAIPSAAEALARRALAMWVERKRSTYDIDKLLGMEEHEVDKIVHRGRRRG